MIKFATGGRDADLSITKGFEGQVQKGVTAPSFFGRSLDFIGGV